MKKNILFFIIISLLLISFISCNKVVLPTNTASTVAASAATGGTAVTNYTDQTLTSQFFTSGDSPTSHEATDMPIGSIEISISTIESASSISETTSPTSPIYTTKETVELTTQTSTTAVGTEVFEPTVIIYKDENFRYSDVISGGHYSSNRNNIVRNRFNPVCDSIVLLSAFKDLFTESGAVGYIPMTAYYDISSGEIKEFCPSSPCNHVFDRFSNEKYNPQSVICAGRALANGLSGQSSNTVAPVFVESRIYFVLCSTVFSCLENGSDIRVVASFENENATWFSESSRHDVIDCLYSDNNQLFFTNNKSDGIIEYYRYDVKTNELFEIGVSIRALEKELGASLFLKSIVNGEMFFEAYKAVTRVVPSNGAYNPYVDGEFVGSYIMNCYSMQIESISKIIPAPDFVMQNGYLVLEITNTNQMEFVFYSNDGKRAVIINDIFEAFGIENDPNRISMLYLDERSIYYSVSEYKKISDRLTNVSGGKVYRYDFETGTSVCIFENERYDRFSISYIDFGKKVALLVATEYELLPNGKYGTGNHKLLLKCNIDENGYLTPQESVK